MIKVVYLVRSFHGEAKSFTSLAALVRYLSVRLPYDNILTIERKSYVV